MWRTSSGTYKEEDLQLTFRSDNLTEVEGYMDSNYADNPDNRKSTSGYMFTYDGGAISWRLKLQDFTTLSTTEDDDIAASKVAKEPIWLHRLSVDLSVKSRTNHLVPTLYCDSWVQYISSLIRYTMLKWSILRWGTITFRSSPMTRSSKFERWIQRWTSPTAWQSHS